LARPRDGEDQGFVRGPFEDTKDQGSETQWNKDLKQNTTICLHTSPSFASNFHSIEFHYLDL
jgi:hypothetical protein